MDNTYIVSTNVDEDIIRQVANDLIKANNYEDFMNKAYYLRNLLNNICL